MKNYLILALLFLFGLSSLSYAQGSICAEIEPFCAGGNALVFPNSHPGIPGASNSAEAGINYSCTTGNGPNDPSLWPYPSWYYLKIDSDGDLNFSISQAENADGSGMSFDVDFIAWGPFSDTNINCGADLTSFTKIDCSWLPSTTESMNISGASEGDVYVVMITNFSQQPGFITLEQTNAGNSSSGSTDCSIVNSIELCSNEVTSLDATTLDAVTYEWFSNEDLLPETGPILNNVVSPSMGYTANAYNAAGAIISVIEFNVNFFEQPIANLVDDQLICDDNNDGFWNFDLSVLEMDVLGGQSTSDFNISFHRTLNDADIGISSLPLIYTNQVAYQQESIFVRIENAEKRTCYATTEFLINVFNQPTATPVIYQLCDNDLDMDDTNGFVEFNLSSVDTEVLNGQDASQFTVTYHLDLANAEADENPLGNIHTNTFKSTDDIFARVERNDYPDCYETAMVTLIVKDLPDVENAVQLIQCDDDSDGLSDFNLNEAKELISMNFLAETMTFHNSFDDADNALGAIINPTSYRNTDSSSNPDVLFVRVENTEGCHRVTPLELLVEATQIPVTVEILYEECDTIDIVDSNITNGITSFDFSDAESQIRAQSGFPSGQNLTFSYYQTEVDALAEINAIQDISNYRNETSPFEQDIYVRVDGDIDNSCVGLGVHVKLRTINPTPNTDPENIELCDRVNTGDRVEDFNLRENEAFIENGEADLISTYHTVLEDAHSGSNPIVDPTQYRNIESPQQEIYVRVTNAITDCYAVVNFTIIVRPLPEVVPLTDFIVCELNSDGFDTFNLTSKDTEVLNGQDPGQFMVSYHQNLIDAESGMNGLVSPYNNLDNPQQIFVTITNNVTGCSISTQSFNIEVQEAAAANADTDPILYEECDDNMEIDGDPSNDSVQFDLTTRDVDILDGQDETNYIVTYFESEEDANLNINPLPTLYENKVNPQVVYARVDNNTPNIIPGADTSICYALAPFTLQVNPLPEFDLEDSYILCVDTNGTEVLNPLVIETGLSTTTYSFEWSYNGVILIGETDSSLIPTQGGTYSVTVTDLSTSTVTSCTNTDSTEVIESEPPILEVNLVTQAFADNHVIEALATGIGVYEYSLDDGPWQDEGTFSNVSAGEHEITARDKNGCGIVTESIFVIDYPKYFTPNGDGNHDTWNIPNIGSNAKIYIFDRYGKLLKQLSPTGQGWNGTFNGDIMPTSDYWFMVQYDEPLTNKRKEFKAHFTLKR
ncbi:T9SS type B sorting domain-containing protein [Winogradskyella sp. R77965]|uniref:T9SS type B sorting domain-containing protein n=1 Tax=Winogradskyella sp. R77965 TaxID=3093872 RepID=UPI0037DCAC91